MAAATKTPKANGPKANGNGGGLAKPVQLVGFMCVCGYGQKGDDGSERPPTPKWDGTTYIYVAEGEEPACPMKDCHYLLEGPQSAASYELAQRIATLEAELAELRAAKR